MTTTPVAEPLRSGEPAAVALPAPVRGSLSPSRAGDFMTCPLKYRFRVLDRLPEQASSAATRGTLVHAVLEQLFELPPRERTPDAAAALVGPAWEKAVAEEPELAVLAGEGPAALAAWLTGATKLVTSYFALEDPRRLQPAARELFLEHELPSGLTLRGIIDRLDQARTGEVRVVDYKTGRSPGPGHEHRALFQMKFYALVLLRSRGVLVRELRLYYLGDRQSIVYHPDVAELEGFERTLHALWEAIDRARVTGDWRPSPGRLCDWCDYKALCPAFGGTPPPLPVTRVLDEQVLDEPPPAERDAQG
jgi:putative RecB family exonuclease